MHQFRLLLNGGHGVAVILFLRIDLAEDFVVHQVIDQNLQAGQVGPFNPFVVALVVLQGVIARPERKVRPTAGFVGPRIAGDLFHQAGEALGAMVFCAIVEGVIDTEFVEGVAIVDPAADEFVGGDMAVGIHVAEQVVVIDARGAAEAIHLLQVNGRAAVGHGGVQFGFRVAAAAVGVVEHKTGVGVFQTR